MSCLVQQPAPDFTADAVLADGSFGKVSLSELRGQPVVLFFYPLDFTFVCPTEIIAFSDRYADFAERKVHLLGASVDSLYSHLAWRERPRSQGGIGKVAYPLLADLDKSIARDYGVLLPGGVALRGLFLIDREGIVRHQVINDLPLGRNVDEALRMVDALAYFEEHGEVCPANWKQGELSMKANPQESQEYFREQYSDVAG